MDYRFFACIARRAAPMGFRHAAATRDLPAERPAFFWGLAEPCFAPPVPMRPGCMQRCLSGVCALSGVGGGFGGSGTGARNHAVHVAILREDRPQELLAQCCIG